MEKLGFLEYFLENESNFLRNTSCKCLGWDTDKWETALPGSKGDIFLSQNRKEDEWSKEEKGSCSAI